MIRVKEDSANKRTLLTVDNATYRVRRGLREGLLTIGKENSKHVKRLIRKPPKTGRIYSKGGRRIRASAPEKHRQTDQVVLHGRSVIGFQVGLDVNSEIGHHTENSWRTGQGRWNHDHTLSGLQMRKGVTTTTPLHNRQERRSTGNETS